MAVAEEVEAALPDLAREAFGVFPHPHSELSSRLWRNTLWAFRADTIYRRVASDILAGGKPFDLMLVYFGGPDVVGHRFWRYMYPGEFEHPPTREEIEDFSEVIRDYYRWVDAAIGSLLDAVGGEATVLVLSDHGMHTVNEGGPSILTSRPTMCSRENTIARRPAS
jgi:predicted AlkP superfamily pyrophosphatase or phosphodiesterase